MEMTWASSQPSSPSELQNFFITEVYRPADRQSLLAQFAKRIMVDGESMAIPSYEKLAVKSSINRPSESSDFSESSLTLDGKRVSMQLKGHAILLNETLINRNKSIYDIINIVKGELQQEMKVQIEEIVKEAMDDTPLKVSLTGLTNFTTATNGTASGTALYNVNIHHLERMALLLTDTYAVPRLNGSYHGVFRGEAILSLRSDSRFQAAHEGLPAYLQEFQVANVAGIKLYHHIESSVLSNSLGAGGLSEGLVFGANPCWFGMVSPFQIYMDYAELQANRYGTKKALWYKADCAAGVPFPEDAAEKYRTSVIHVTSA